VALLLIPALEEDAVIVATCLEQPKNLCVVRGGELQIRNQNLDM
jgi:hypothetical protein